MRRILFFVTLLFSLSPYAAAQSFSSGSTGTDGALDLSTGACQRQIQLPESGILNYTVINIPYLCSITFKPNFRNTPVTILAQGDVVIGGTISVMATGNVPGPGGYYGGGPSKNGFGPGGGTSESPNGRWVGSISLIPIVGGSGGFGGAGGGGGGAIVIASSASINVSGYIYANGMYGGGNFGTTGSGGAIRLVANSVNVSGHFEARGGAGISGSQGLAPGIVRLEAPAAALQYSGSSDPLPILSTTINPQVVTGSNTPSLNIISIGGYTVPYATGRPDSVDLMLPNSLADPINVAVQAANIPVGTQVSLNISGSSGVTYTPGTLSGTQSSSSTVIPVTGLSRSGATFILAYAEYTLPPEAAQYNSKGPDQVAKVHVEVGLDGKQKFVFLRGNGSAIEMAKVPEALRNIFGQ